MHLEAVGHAFNGVRAGVTALILTSVIKLFKGAVKDSFTTAVYVIVLALAAAGNFIDLPASVPAAGLTVWNIVTSPVFLVIAAGAAGLAARFRRGGQKK